MNLKPAACIATKPLQKENLEAAKLSKLCLRIEKVLEVCDKRNYALAISVKGRITFTTDLYTADAVYHTACDLSFRICKNLSKKYSENENLASPGLGRPVFSDLEKVFQQLIEYLRANDEEQITLNDLKQFMDSFLKDSPHEAFTTKWIKHKLQEQLKDEIVITEINGKPNVVLFELQQLKYCKIFIANEDVVIQREKKKE